MIDCIKVHCGHYGLKMDKSIKQMHKIIKNFVSNFYKSRYQIISLSLNWNWKKVTNDYNFVYNYIFLYTLFAIVIW